MNDHRPTVRLQVHLTEPGHQKRPANVEDIIQVLDGALGAKALAVAHERTTVHQFTPSSIVIRVPPNGHGGAFNSILITLMSPSAADRADMQHIYDVVRAYEYVNGDKYESVFEKVRGARHGTASQADLAAIAEQLGIS